MIAFSNFRSLSLHESKKLTAYKEAMGRDKGARVVELDIEIENLKTKQGEIKGSLLPWGKKFIEQHKKSKDYKETSGLVRMKGMDLTFRKVKDWLQLAHPNLFLNKAFFFFFCLGWDKED